MGKFDIPDEPTWVDVEDALFEARARADGSLELSAALRTLEQVFEMEWHQKMDGGYYAKREEEDEG